MLSAVKPTNFLTLGNYIGAIRTWVELQRDFECTFFVVDLHAITVRQDPKELREDTYQVLAFYLAAGIDPGHADLFVQSHVPAHSEFAWILMCHAYMGELSRMTQFKDQAARTGESIGAGLFGYPVLMAADILLYDTNLVPVGADQKQHIELTRDLALRMNHLYGENLLTVPEPYIPPVGARIMSLQNPEIKMSKSDPDPMGAVYLMDSDDTILKKLKKAVTDSGTEITDSDEKPGIRNLLSIQSALTGKPIRDLVESYRGKMYGHLKLETAEHVIAVLGPLRKRATAYLQDRGELDQILRAGAERARIRAERKLKLIQEQIGLLKS